MNPSDPAAEHLSPSKCKLVSLNESSAQGIAGMLNRILPRRTPRASTQRAIRWIKNHRIPASGIAVHSKSRIPSQEVTGYLIPTLYAWGERTLAKELAAWEAMIQHPTGAFLAPDGIPYTFDTAQVMRGFLSLLDEIPQLESNLRRACEFVATHISKNGEVKTPSYAMWRTPGGGVFSEYTNLYVIPPLLEAGNRLQEPSYVNAALRALSYYMSRDDLVEFKPSLSTFSHIFGYMLEALIDLGEIDLARKGLSQAAAIQRDDGAIPAFPGAEWVCSTGMAQLSLAWYKVGDVEYADRALSYLESIQNRSGGWFGSYGPGAAYFPDAEISWAPKFFLDCWMSKPPVGAQGQVRP